MVWKNLSENLGQPNSMATELARAEQRKTPLTSNYYRKSVVRTVAGTCEVLSKGQDADDGIMITRWLNGIWLRH